MRSGKVTGRMISDMARESLRASRMRNAFVAVTIALASALLTAIFLFALGQKELEREALSHRQQVSYYELVPEQLELLEGDGRIAYQIQVKSGILSETEGFGVVPRYVSGLSDEIQAGGSWRAAGCPKRRTKSRSRAPCWKRWDCRRLWAAACP